MKNLALLMALLVTSSAAMAEKVDPKNVNLRCDPIITYGNLNDDWTVTIVGKKSNLWDNDSGSDGKYLKTVETGGGSQYFVYSGTEGGSWKFYIDAWAVSSTNKSGEVYGTLYYNSNKDSGIFKCVKLTAKEIAEFNSSSEE